MVTRAICGYPEATRSLVTGIDVGGIDVVITDPSGDHPSRVEFQVPIEVPDHLTLALIDLLDRARAASGEDGQTSAERETASLGSIRTHITEVEIGRASCRERVCQYV